MYTYDVGRCAFEAACTCDVDLRGRGVRAVNLVSLYSRARIKQGAY
jgi:hypothetical protein